METIRIKRTDDTPNVILDAENGLFEISERSFPQDATSFYSPIINWVNKFAAGPKQKINFIFKLEYFNTASSKQLFTILNLLDGISPKENVTISWYYLKGDKDMHTSGLRYSKLTNLRFNFIEL